MRAPSFWQTQERSWQAILLAPLGLAYDAATRLRFALARPYSSALPVICVGNLVAGGAGKTPVALALAALLGGRGLSPVFLSRGYGGAKAGPLRVDPATHTAAEVGDEPLLLARAAPTIIARDRAAGARLAEDSGAQLIIMDDGLQNPSLIKMVAFAVVDADLGVGNGRVIPAGPLRAGLAFQFTLIDALIVVGEGKAGVALVAEAEQRGLPVFRARVRAQDPAALAGERVVAFAGIARPEKFFATLAATGTHLAARRGFGDHQVLSEREAEELLALAEREKASLVSTEKDLARLKGRTGAAGRLAEKTRPLAIALGFEAPEAILDFLGEKGALRKG